MKNPSSSRIRSFVVLAALLSIAGTAACNDTPFQVIEQLDFAPSLGVDLDSMVQLPSGIYYRDLVVGTGNTVFPSSEVRVEFEGFISDGSSFGDGEFNFALGTGSVIPGFELGIIGMYQGGVRKIVIPPDLGYGEENQTGIPAGSVIIFDVTMVDVTTIDSPN